MKTVAVIGALDTKGAEFAFVKTALLERGCRALVIDTGILGDPPFEPDISAADVANAGGGSLADMRQERDRGTAVATMARGAARLCADLYQNGQIDAVLGMGGSAGTIIATAGMRALPLGVPKVMVSTLAAADTSPYIGTKDIVMMPAIVDVAGVNSISAKIFANAVGAVVGMVQTTPPAIDGRPLIAASMFGNTTELVDRCRKMLDEAGYEVLVFHATGTGGRSMEGLIEDGYMVATLDVTPTELADELADGVLTAGPTRMVAAGRRGLPQVIAPGCLDMVNFWARNTVPERYEGRLFYEWNPNVTLMRTNIEESAELGRILAEKANSSAGPVAIFWPAKGLSVLDSPDGLFWWPEANAALLNSLKTNLRDGIPVFELPYNINDAAFADAVTQQLIKFLQS